MAVQRDAQPARLDPAAMTNVNIQPAGGPMSSASRPVGQTGPTDMGMRLLSLADQIADRAVQYSAESEYLKGANAAAAGQAQESLDSDPLTKPFQTGGFQDQAKRMQMAKAASDIATKMTEYRTKTPEEFGKVLNEQTQGIFNSTDGMTLNGRRSLMEQQLTFNNTLIKTQAAEHGKYLVEQRAQMYNTQGFTLASMVAQAKATGDEASYAAGAAQTLVWAKSIMTDDKLPLKVRQEQIVSMMGYMLSQDLRAPVETLLKTGIVDGIGMDDLAKLQTQVRESRSRTQLQDNQQLLDTFAMQQAQQDTAGNVSIDDWNKTLDGLARNNLMSADKYVAENVQFLKNYAKNMKAAQVGNMYASGDQTGMLKLGATEEDGATAYIKSMTKQGADANTIAFGLLDIGAAHGYPSAYKQSAKILEPALSNFGTTDEMSPDAETLVTTMLNKVDAAQTKGDKLAFSKLLGGLSPENQEKMVFLREQIKSGKTPNQAAQAYTKQQQDYAGLTPNQRSTILAQRQSDVNAVVQELDSQGRLSRIWSGLAGVFSDTSAGLYQARVASGDLTANTELSAVKAAYQEELQAVVLKNPQISKDGMAALASAQLAQRVARVGETTLSPGSVLVAPRGRTVQSMFGLDPNVTADRVGHAIGQLEQAKAPEGYEPVYQFAPNGTLSVSYMNKNGDVAPHTVEIGADVVRKQIQDDDLAAATANNDVYGTGKLFVDKQTNLGLRVSGTNTAGVDEGQMLLARARLIEFEGVRDTPYRDGNGNTNGVGIHYNSPFYEPGNIGGQWTGAQIQRSFVKHSDMTAKRSVVTAQQLGWSTDNPNQFQFLMQIGYQAGVGWAQAKNYKGLADAIRTGDASGALAALHSTPAYQQAGKSRQQYYDMTLTKGMQE